MNRYKKANQGIHAPEDLKEKVITSRRPARRGRPALWGAAAAVLAVCILAGAVLWPGSRPGANQPGASLTVHPLAIAQAVYPETVPFPDLADYRDAAGQEDYDAYSEAMSAWDRAERQRQAQPVDNESMAGYYGATMAEFLGDNGGENSVYSPLNLYLALAMLAECTDGDSRQQILDLLGADGIEALRTQASALWNANYLGNGGAAATLANSLWLREGQSYVQETVDRLADTYYASVYRGVMGSDEMDQALQDWLNEQTGGLLEEYANGVETDPDTLLALASAIYFKAPWLEKFSQGNTAAQTFHGTAGDVETDFMRQTLSDSSYYWGDNFSAVAKEFSSGGEMWLILPDEGTAPEDLLAGSELTDFLLAGKSWENKGTAEIHLSMPRFDVAAETDLIGGLQELGVTDVFDAGLADFTPVLGEGEEASVTQATHAARVKVDEDGCEGAAYTIVMMEEAALLEKDEVDFVLDRPFLFAVTSETGQLLFVGIVNQV